MSKKSNIIEINGRRYDAATGEPLSGVEIGETRSKPAAVAHTANVRHAAKPAVTRHAPKHAKRHRPTASHTLKRQAVKKPAASFKRQRKAHGPASQPAAATLLHLSNHSQPHHQQAMRTQHANQVAKSQLIAHFSSSANTKHQGPHMTVAAHSQPAHKLQVHPRRPATTNRPKTTAELLEHAIQFATSHTEPPVKVNRYSRKLRAGSALVLTLALFGMVTAQNIPKARLQTASAEAGFSASLPNYQPPGFSRGQLMYDSGVVTANFHSNSDSRSYTITQKASAWDSSTLRNSFVATHDANYQTIVANNRTVFLYGQHNATWVDGSVWYTVQSDGSLSSRQLIELATST